jgi:hypothetical protein
MYVFKAKIKTRDYAIDLMLAFQTLEQHQQVARFART